MRQALGRAGAPPRNLHRGQGEEGLADDGLGAAEETRNKRLIFHDLDDEGMHGDHPARPVGVAEVQSVSRTFRARMSGVNGFCRK